MSFIPHTSEWFPPRPLMSNAQRSKRAILEQVERETGVPPQIVLGKSRRPGHVSARYQAMYLMKAGLRLSYPRIGRIFGKDHSSVIHGVREHCRRNGLELPK